MPRFSIRTCLLVTTLVAISIPAEKYLYFQLNPPTQIRLLNALNTIDGEALLYFNNEHPDPNYRRTPAQHSIAACVQILADVGLPVQWDTKTKKYLFAKSSSKRAWYRDKGIDEWLSQ